MAGKTPGRKTLSKSDALEILKADIAAGTIANAYIFHGEETWLRNEYIAKIRDALIPEAFSAFNYHRTEGENMTVQTLSEMAEAMPMMSERTLITVRDFDILRLPDEQSMRLAELLNDLPPWCCILFVYDTVAYKPRKTSGESDSHSGKDSDTSPSGKNAETSSGKKSDSKAAKQLRQAIRNHVQTVDFRPLDEPALREWVVQRFAQSGKRISSATADYFIFTCGELMEGLASEIAKISAYAASGTVSQSDIDAVVDPVLSTEAFRLSDAVLKGDYNRAAVILGDLLKMRLEPIMILAVLAGQLRRIYTARLALENGKNRSWVQNMWGMKDYPAKLCMSAAERTSLAWCSNALRMCEELDRRLKSESGIDGPGELKFLLIRLAARETNGRTRSYRYGQR